MIKTKIFNTRSATGKQQVQIVTQQINKALKDTHPKKYKDIGETIIELSFKNELEVI